MRDNSSIVVTGASGTLGSAVARALRAAGARLTLASGNRLALDRLGAELGPDAVTVACRAETAAEAERIVQAAVTRHGCVDGAFIAGGTNQTIPTLDMTIESFDAIMKGNIREPWLLCQALGRQLVTQPSGGSIVLVSSTRGRLGHQLGLSAYCASKGALEALVRALAAEWGRSSVRVNAVAPSAFNSPLAGWLSRTDAAADVARSELLRRTPLGRLGTAEDMVGSVLFLLSDASSFCTGQTLYVDGGQTSC